MCVMPFDINEEIRCLEEDKFHDECGVFGIYEPGAQDIARSVYFGLHSLQHRGQESAGIAANKNGKIQYYKEMGLVSEVFNDQVMTRLQGDICIGHVRYSTAGESQVENSQPLVIYSSKGAIALAHNGNLVNSNMIRNSLKDNGVIFQTEIDSEIIAALIAKELKDSDLLEATKSAVETVEGAFALVITSGNMLIGVRDPNGIRPLCIGKTKNGYILSSESCVFPLQGAKFLRDVKPGEIVVIENNELKSFRFGKNPRRAVCAFEYVYFARPDSKIDDVSVYASRREAGKILAREYPVDADLVISVPDSGTVAAIGYAEESGIPYGEGLMKNRYIGRTFIQPTQEMRDLSVRMKLNVLTENVAGKRIVMIDDSVVRGTTSGKIVKMLKDAGASEIHVRISSPPVQYSCYMGINTPHRNRLIAANMTMDEMCKYMGADSLGFLSQEGLCKSITLGEGNICCACFDGNYPVTLTDIKNNLEDDEVDNNLIVGEYD